MSSGDKTEQASSQKLDKAKKQGQIARAKEFSTTIVLIVCTCYFYVYGGELKTAIVNLFEVAYHFDAKSLSDQKHTLNLIGHALFILVKTFAPLMLFQVLAATISSSVLGGLNFNLSLIAPKFSKINPLAGLKRIYSKQTVVEFIKNLLKIAIIFAILYWFLRSNMGTLGGLVRASFDTVADVSLGFLFNMLVMLISVAVVFGILDIPYQKMTFGKQMMMTKDEVKQEHKDQEGRPEIKSRIRQIQMQNARRSASATVPSADVVLMNPTHYAVALKYDIAKADAPFVVAKGKNEVAFYIRSLADKHQIEVLEVPDLTRSIYHTTQVNQMVPNQLFVAVAHILKYVQQLQAWKSGQQIRPTSLPSFTIPKELRY